MERNILEYMVNIIVLIGGISFAFYLAGFVRIISYYKELNINPSLLDFNYHYYLIQGISSYLTEIIVISGFLLFILLFRYSMLQKIDFFKNELSSIEKGTKAFRKDELSKKELQRVNTVLAEIDFHKNEKGGALDNHKKLKNAFSAYLEKSISYIFYIIITINFIFAIVIYFSTDSIKIPTERLINAIVALVMLSFYLFFIKGYLFALDLSARMSARIMILPIFLIFIFIVVPFLSGYVEAKIDKKENNFNSIVIETVNQDILKSKYILNNQGMFFLYDKNLGLIMLPIDEVKKAYFENR